MSLSIDDLNITRRDIPISRRVRKSIKKRKSGFSKLSSSLKGLFYNYTSPVRRGIRIVKRRKIREAGVWRSASKGLNTFASSLRSNPAGRFQGGQVLQSPAKRLNDRLSMIRGANQKPGSSIGLKELGGFRTGAPKARPRRLMPDKKSMSSALSPTRRKNLAKSNMNRIGAQSARSIPGQRRVGRLY